ncbi:ribosomal protein S5 domain 2-like protein [Dentipellis sp. KUC8613]|nr:ribosomal protein S5 domain 2-like protein [Dentipellis sp. KUC8613]
MLSLLRLSRTAFRLKGPQMVYPSTSRSFAAGKTTNASLGDVESRSNGSPAGSWPFPVSASSYVETQKSTFIAYSSRLASASDLPDFISHLRLSSSRLKRATHCMVAFRLASPTSGEGGKPVQMVCGQDDGGESGAGNMLMSVLEKGECVGAVVVVWRWYGGVKLGGERWRVIGQVAREALRAGGFLQEGKRDTKVAAPAKGKSNAAGRRK